MAAQLAPSLTAQCREAVAILDRALDLPPLQVGREVDEVENLVARLRDALIARLRQAEIAPEVSRLREALSLANMALSLIVGVEYPATGLQRSAIEEARDTLARLLAEDRLA